ncbi:hypothetical protein CEXT_717021 [Caerostris extrusa]|uniref:Uncharacterized protein n=1 Tax=Caerostris extrusa TaxID=172846 RepID=A0AAV4PSG6_CAEEX|nr:hypothetical protein CEXT_717021 [Caerostris extrusa]
MLLPRSPTSKNSFQKRHNSKKSTFHLSGKMSGLGKREVVQPVSIIKLKTREQSLLSVFFQLLWGSLSPCFHQSVWRGEKFAELSDDRNCCTGST